MVTGACVAARVPETPLPNIEDFERVPVGGLAGAVTDPNGKAQWSASVVSPGHGGQRCLHLASIRTLNQTTWILEHPSNLARYQGIRMFAKASRPLDEIHIMLDAGGRLFFRSPVGTDWREIRVSFEDSAGYGRFEPRRFRSISVHAQSATGDPVDIWIDDIAAFGESRASASLRSLFNGDNGLAWVPFSWLSPNVLNASEMGLWILDSADNVWVDPFFTSPQSYMRGNIASSLGDARTARVRLAHLTASIAGFDGILATLRVEPSVPSTIVKFWLSEEGGEQWLALRDAPAKLEDVSVPFGEFFPDAARNLKVPANAQNGVLDLDRVTMWGVELIPTTEEPFRGRLYLKGAWAVRK